MFEQTKALCDRFYEQGVPTLDLIVYQNGKEVLRYMRGAPNMGQRTYLMDAVLADLAGTTMEKITQSSGTYDLTY